MSHERVDWHISQRIRFADKLREINQLDLATKMYNSVFSLEEDNFSALNGLFAASIGLCGKPYNNIRWEDFNIGNFEKILEHCPNSKIQLRIVQQYLDACISSIDKRDYGDFVYHDKTLEQLLKYFPASESKKMYSYVDEISDCFLKEGKYDLAIKYANISLQNEPTYNIKARCNILFATLKCDKLTDFVKCEQFDKNMQEYKLLLLSCKGNDEALQKYIEIAKKNEKFVSEAKRKRADEAQKAQEKKEREEREAAQRKAREEREEAERQAQLRADKAAVLEKHHDVRTRAIVFLLFPVGMLILALIGGKNIDWEYFEDATYAPVILIITLFIVAITNWVFSYKCFNISSMLRDANVLEPNLLTTTNNTLSNSKTVTIISIISACLEFSLFYLPVIIMGVAILVLIVLLIVLIGFLYVVFTGGK